MKNLITICLFMVTIFAANGQPPASAKKVKSHANFEDTRDFIVAKVKSWANFGTELIFTIDEDKLTQCYSYVKNERKPTEIQIIKFADVKSIGIGAGFINVSGKSTIRDISDPAVRDEQTNDGVRIFFKETIPSAEKEKILKALKHLVIIKGAKLIDDDLF